MMWEWSTSPAESRDPVLPAAMGSLLRETKPWTSRAPEALVEPVCTGFRLYQQGALAPICTFAGGDTRAGDCAATIDRRTTAFTLTATFADNTESPHSAPFAFTDQLPAPGIRSLTISQSITISQ